MGWRTGERPCPAPAGVLHRPAGPAEEGQPEHGRRLPRYLQAPPHVRAGQDREGPQQSQPRGPGRRSGRRVPAAPGRRPGKRQRHPQRPAGRGPLAVPLCGPAGTRARRRHQPGPGHPAEAARAGHRQLPHPGGDRRAGRRPRPQNLARPPRPRPDPARRPDRAAGIGTHRAHPPGRPPGRRPARPLPGQRPQRTGQRRSPHRPSGC